MNNLIVKPPTILYNGEELQVTEKEIITLLEKNLIWDCDDCNFYHPTPSSTLDTIELFLNK